MVQRAVAVADFERSGRRDSAGDIGFGLATRLLEVELLGQSRRDRRRQCEAGTMQILGGDALGRKAHDIALPDQEIDTVVARAVAALDQDIAGSERKSGVTGK